MFSKEEMEMIDKVDKKKKEEQKKEIEMSTGQAASLAVKYMFEPTDERLVEVSNLSIGIIHSLTMLQAYEEHFSVVLEQVRARQEWFIKRAIRRNCKKDKEGNVIWGDEEEEEFVSKCEELKTLDPMRDTELFVHRFRHALYQHSRGKEGKLLEIGEILADTDLQNRSTDMSDAFRNPIRGQ